MVLKGEVPHRVSGGGSGLKVMAMKIDLVGDKCKPWMVAQEEVVYRADWMRVCRACKEQSEE